MKRLKYFLITICSCIILFFIVDLYFFRFYFSEIAINSHNKSHLENSENEYEIENESFDLKIKAEKGFYIITLKNKTVKPFLTMSPCRNNQIRYHVNDSIFNTLYRAKFSTSKYKSKYDYSLGCTGSGPFSINPYESFSYKISRRALLNQFNFNSIDFFNKYDITAKENINIQLYLNVYTYNFRHHMIVESNSISLPYKEVIKYFN